MADNTDIALNVKVDGVEKSINSIKELKEAIKAAKDEQVKAATTFGESSKEYVDATKKLSGLKDKVDDLNDSTKSLKGTGVEQLTQGFAQMKEGIMNLDFEKVKVGITAMKAGIGQFATAAKTAFQGVKGALLATGIGALVVILGTIIAYWDDIKGAIDGVSSEQKKLNEESKKNVEIEKEKLNSLNSQDNLLKLQGKSEKEILQLKIKQVDAVYEAAEAQLKNILLTQEAQRKAEQRNKEILTGIIEWTLKPIELIARSMDAVGSALGQNLGLAEKIKNISKEAGKIDYSEEEAARKKEFDDQIKQLTEIKNQRAGFQLSINKIDSDAAAERKAEADKRAAEEKARKDAQLADDLKYMQQIEDAKLQSIQNEEQRASIKAALDKQKRDAEIENSKASEAVKQQALLASEQTFQNEMQKIYDAKKAKDKANEDAAIAAKKAQREQELNDEVLKAELKVTQNQGDLQAELDLLLAKKNLAVEQANGKENEIALIEAKYRQDKKAAEDADREEKRLKEEEERNRNFEAAKGALNSLQAISDAYFAVKSANTKKGSAEEEKAARKQFEINKGIAIASATISGIQGVINALSAQSVIPEPYGTILKVITAAGIAASTVANISKISSTPFQTGGGGGGGGGAVTSVPTPAPPTINTPSANTNQSTTFDQTGKNLNQQPTNPTINVNATVGVDEVSDKQKRVTALETQSTF